MIKIKNKFIKLVLFSKNSNFFDFLDVITYTFYLGNNRPFLLVKRKAHTILINLEQSADEILRQMKSNTRNEIRRAIRENLRVEQNENVEDFIIFYNNFAEGKGLSKIGIENVTKYPDFRVFKVIYGDVVLSQHVHMVDKEAGISRLLYSASARFYDKVDSKFIGMGNRLLHFEEFKYFKKIGIKTYDWGGVYIGQKDKAKMGIARFKKSFGGKVVEQYNYTSIIYLLLVKIKSLIGFFF